VSWLFSFLIVSASAHEIAVFAGAFGSAPNLSQQASALTPGRIKFVRLRLLQRDFVLLDRVVEISEFDVSLGRGVSLKLGWNRIQQVQAALEGRWLDRVFVAFYDEGKVMIAEGWLTAAQASPLLGLDWSTRAQNRIARLCARGL